MNVGGPAVLLSPLFDALVAPEFEHILVTGKCPSEEIDYLDSHPLNNSVIYLDGVSRAIGPVGDLIGFFKLCKIIRRFKPDLVHTHTSKAGFLGRLAAFLVLPQAVRIHTFHGHVLSGYFSPTVTKVFRTLEHLLGLITDIPIAVTEPVKRDLINFGICSQKSWQVIHPGIDTGKSILQKTEHSKFTIGWIGRFAPIKNPLLAINAFNILQKESPDKFAFKMAGEGELFEESKALASSAGLEIEFYGWLEETQKFYSAIDLLYLTSINEGLGMVILEAAENDVPTLANDVGGISDFIQNNVTGFFAAPTSEAFSAKTLELVNSPSLLKTVALTAKNLVHTEFNSDTFVKKHLQLYKEVGLQAQ